MILKSRKFKIMMLFFILFYFISSSYQQKVNLPSISDLFNENEVGKLKNNQEEVGIQSVFDNHLFFYNALKQYDRANKYDFDSRWFLPSFIIVNLESKYFTLDERRFLLHDSNMLQGSLWVNRTVYHERKLFHYTSEIRQILKAQKLSGNGKGQQIFRKYVINPLLHQGQQFHIEVIIDLISEYPLVATYLGGYISQSTYIFKETNIDDKCAHLLVCNNTNDLTYYPDYQDFLINQIGYERADVLEIDTKIKASLTYTLQAISKAIRESSHLNSHDNQQFRVKYMGALKCFILLNKLQEAYVYSCQRARNIPNEWKSILLEARKNRKIREGSYLIDENKRYSYLSEFDGQQFQRTFLMEQFRASVAYVVPSPYNVYYVNYFNNHQNKWILLQDPIQEKFTQQDVYDADIIITAPGFTPDPNHFRHGIAIINHVDHSETLSSFTNLIYMFRQFDKLNKYAFNSSHFIPQSYLFNLETHQFSQDEEIIMNLPQRGVWLLRSDNGKYMRLLHDLKALKEEIREHKGTLPNSDLVLRHYVVKPYLIEGRAFILRTYAFIISSNPFVLVSKIGYLRFCQDKFDLFSNKPFSTIEGDKPDIDDRDFLTASQLYQILGTSGGLSQDRINRMIADIQLSISYVIQAVFDTLDHRENQVENLRFDFQIDQDLSPYLMHIEVDSNSFTSNQNVYSYIQQIDNEFLDLVFYSHDRVEQRKPLLNQVITQICNDCRVLINQSVDLNILNSVGPRDFQPNQNSIHNQNVVLPPNFKPTELILEKQVLQDL